MAYIACFLLGNRLIVRQRKVNFGNDLFSIFGGEPVTFRPADRLGIRKGWPSIIWTMNIVPRPHGTLTKVCTHHAGIELFHFLGVARGFTACRTGDDGVISEG